MNEMKFIYVFGDEDSRQLESKGHELVAKWAGVGDDVWVYVYQFSDKALEDVSGIEHFTTNRLYFGVSAKSLGYGAPDLRLEV